MQKGLWWYEIPKDPKGAWVSHRIGDAVLGAISPNGVIDVNGDGKPDILRGNVWFENKGNGTEWVEVIVNEQEELLPLGRTNPRWIVWRNKGKGVFEETIILDSKPGGHELQVGDVDGDGKLDICSKAWGPSSWNGVGGKMHVDFLKNTTDRK